LQYYQETTHFETVKAFLSVKYQISAISVIEYLEYRSLLFISCYVAGIDLANYLLVLNGDGEILLKEKIGGQLKGIGVDTFFILSGYLIFVKNGRELVSYKMVC
jgi:peptidoglycan/LPS O-acetylase OafA/YrhL